MKIEMQVLDKLGQEILPGCFIVYGHLLNRSAALRIGKVVKVKTDVKGDSLFGEKVIYRITVQGIEDGWHEESPKLLSKVSTLYYPERVIVLTENQIPEKYKNLYV